ncbi:Boophilin-G2 [Orchesella cincta]|uniref:Boophilin-G2 n=1 Tax=Orchesella cincta TaxID=48709 RepID=A0A1D2M1F6_ORCCI|nr:Boophilin-G2 [Orchesella cincta]
MFKSAIIATFAVLAILICFNSASAGGLDACTLPSDEGSCLAMGKKFFFNTATKQCEIFNYGGCGGNANQFETKEDCDKACGHLA